MKYCFITFFIYKKRLTGYYQKNKESFQNSLVERTKIFLKKKKAKGANMLMRDIEIFLIKKKKRSVKNLLEDEYRKKISRMQEIKTG